MIVAPVLELRLMPVPVSSIGPLKAVVPPVRFATDTECAADPVTVAATVTSAGAAVEVDAVAARRRDGHAGSSCRPTRS